MIINIGTLNRSLGYWNIISASRSCGTLHETSLKGKTRVEITHNSRRNAPTAPCVNGTGALDVKREYTWYKMEKLRDAHTLHDTYKRGRGKRNHDSKNCNFQNWTTWRQLGASTRHPKNGDDGALLDYCTEWRRWPYFEADLTFTD